MSLAVVGLLPATASATAPTAVATDKGAVRGATSKGVERFLGIPYAAAPTGSLRWNRRGPRACGPAPVFRCTSSSTAVV